MTGATRTWFNSGTTTWALKRHWTDRDAVGRRPADSYEWHVTVGEDEAEGTAPTEPDALREIAFALDWLQGTTAMTGTREKL